MSCKHGRLPRQCPECLAEEEIRDLRHKLEATTEALLGLAVGVELHMHALKTLLDDCLQPLRGVYPEDSPNGAPTTKPGAEQPEDPGY